MSPSPSKTLEDFSLQGRIPVVGSGGPNSRIAAMKGGECPTSHTKCGSPDISGNTKAHRALYNGLYGSTFSAIY